MTTDSLALPADPSAADLARRAIRLVEEGVGRGDFAVLDELMAPDIVEHQRGNGDGIEGAKAVSRTLNRWMSEFSLTVEDVAVNGDTVWTATPASLAITEIVVAAYPSARNRVLAASAIRRRVRAARSSRRLGRRSGEGLTSAMKVEYHSIC